MAGQLSGAPRTLEIRPGANVRHHSKDYVILAVPDFEWVLARNLESKQVDRLLIRELQPAVEVVTEKAPDLLAIPDEDWAVAQDRLDCIRPLLEVGPVRTRQQVEARAAEVGKSAATLYRWLGLYESQQILTHLLPTTRKDKGSTRLSDVVEKLIEQVINDDYLNSQRKKPAAIVEEVGRLCHLAGLDAPHPNTVRARIQALSPRLAMARRQGGKAASEAFDPIRSKFPGADWPLAVTQIDHTEVDIILVDDIDRLPIGRPWITVCIDIFSRMVTGLYISFDPPGSLATGQAIANAILPKETWLAKHDIKADWPVWGRTDVVHADNAKEFRGEMLKRSCDQYKIELKWRPVRRPHYGGHIESMMGTLMGEIHALPGTTFSNPKEREGYNSDAKAVMTLFEFEGWLLELIVGKYHQRRHSELGTSPLAKWKEGILGNDKRAGRGLPARTFDELRLRLDFMPFEWRTVQDYGVQIDKIHYFHDVLRKWINAVDLDNRKLKRQFMFRRDPRDISTIYFFDPEIEEYFPIPYRDSSHPAITLWELRAAQNDARERGIKEVDEAAVFESMTRLKERVEESTKKTRTVRRQQQRSRDGQAKSIVAQYEQAKVRPAPSSPKADLPSAAPDAPVQRKIVPFDDLDLGV